MSNNIVLKVAYDGTRYLGWQRTSSLDNRDLSIEYEIESVLAQILQHPVSLQAASRTDRGVHAKEQVINFYTAKAVNLDHLHRGLNGLLPPDIRCLSVEMAPSADFHATLDAKAKEYRYFIAYDKILLPFYRFTYWHFPYELNTEKMREGAHLITGKHDFAAFQNNRKGKAYDHTVRTIYSIEIEPLDEKRLSIHITGSNFLYKMARNIAGTLAYVGCGKILIDELPAIFEGAQRAAAGMTAPACGLTLYKVYYVPNKQISL